MAANQFAGTRLGEAVDRLLDLKAKAIRARIDAGACGTASDHKRAEKASQELRDAEEDFASAFDADIIGLATERSG